MSVELCACLGLAGVWVIAVVAWAERDLGAMDGRR